MEKPERGMPVRILLADGVEHDIRFPLGVVKRLKVEQGIDLLKFGPEVQRTLDDPERLAVLLSYGLRTGFPEATVEWVEANVDASMLFDIAPRLLYAATGQWIGDLREAAAKALNGASPNGAASEAPTSPSTGLLSGASGATTSISPNENSGT